MSNVIRVARGFTLPELLTAMAVTGVALSLAVPSMNSAITGQRSATAINSLVGTLYLARSTATTRNQPVTLCPSDDGLRCSDSAWAQGWIVFVDPSRQRQPGTEGLLATEAGLPGSMRLESPEFPRFLTYRPNGQATGEQSNHAVGGFWFCEAGSDGTARGLWINATGKPQLVDQQANGRPFECAG